MSGLVVQCYQSSKSDRAKLELSFNSYGIGEHQNNPISNQRDVSGISGEQTSFKSGQLHCQWKVGHATKITYQGNTFDFENSQFYLQLATGPFNPSKSYQVVVSMIKFIITLFFTCTADNQIHFHGKGNTLVSSSAVSLKSKSTL